MKKKNEFEGLIESFDNGDREIKTDKSEENEERLERLMKKPAVYGIAALLAVEFIMLAVLLAFAGREKIIYEGSIGLRQIMNSAGIGSVGNYERLCAEDKELNSAEKFLSCYLADESTVLSMLSPSFVSFVQHEYNVKNYPEYEKELLLRSTDSALVTPNQTFSSATEDTGGTTPIPPETDSPAPDNTPYTTAGPTNTPTQNYGDYKYYQFNLGKSGYSSVVYSGDDAVSAGISSDESSGVDFNVVSDGSRDLNYGVLRIQNPYNAQGFNLKELLQSPLKIPADGSLDRPPVILYYTHTSEGYCSSEEDKLIANKKSLATYDENRNVVGCGNIIEQLVESQGIGVINCNDINDENYNDAYNSSHKLVKNVAAANKSVDLSIDIHSNSFEYPAGKRYGPKVSSGDTDYAKILFVITAGDANPNWQENIKLAMLIIEKMESKVPGISLGISLRNDAKYNSVYTNKSFITEIGFEGNLVSEANATAKILGEVLGEIYG